MLLVHFKITRELLNFYCGQIGQGALRSSTDDPQPRCFPRLSHTVGVKLAFKGSLLHIITRYECLTKAQRATLPKAPQIAALWE